MVKLIKDGTRPLPSFFQKLFSKKVFAQFSQHSIEVLSVQTILSAELLSERFILSFFKQNQTLRKFFKNLKYSIHPFYVAFLFLLKNFVKLEADGHISSRR